MDMTDPEIPPRSKIGFLTRLLMTINGADDDEALRQCARDRGTLMMPGLILLLSFVYLAGLFTLAAHMLFAPSGQFRFALLAIGVFLAFFVLVIDSWMILRASHFQSGAAQIRKAGLDISGGLVSRLKIAIAWTIRIILSLALAQLTALVLCLMVLAPDIDARNQHDFLQANAHLLGPATALVDSEIQRETAAVSEQTKLVNTLAGQVAALRQSAVDPVTADPDFREAGREVAQLIAQKAKADEEVQAAQAFADNEFGGIKGAPQNSGVPGYGLRWKSAIERVAQAKVHAADVGKQLDAARGRLDTLRKQKSAANAALAQQSHDRLPAFEKKLDQENDRLTQLKGQLAQSIANRDDDIRKAVEDAPDFVRLQNGIIARVVALETIVQQDKRLQFIVLLIEVVSLSLESAALLSKLVCPVPTRYATLLARDAYLDDVRMVDEMMDQLNKRDDTKSDDPSPAPGDRPNVGGPSSGGAATPVPSESKDVPASLQGAEPQKRKRGRPRKNPLSPPVKNSNAQGNSEAA